MTSSPYLIPNIAMMMNQRSNKFLASLKVVMRLIIITLLYSKIILARYLIPMTRFSPIYADEDTLLISRRKYQAPNQPILKMGNPFTCGWCLRPCLRMSCTSSCFRGGLESSLSLTTGKISSSTSHARMPTLFVIVLAEMIDSFFILIFSYESIYDWVVRYI